MQSDLDFVRKHQGKVAIQYAGLIIRKVFDSAASAREWADWNYRGRAKWNVCELKNGECVVVTSNQ